MKAKRRKKPSAGPTAEPNPAALPDSAAPSTGRKPAAPRADGAKTIGVPVPPNVYARLRKLADERGLSMKEAALAAITMGLNETRF